MLYTPLYLEEESCAGAEVSRSISTKQREVGRDSTEKAGPLPSTSAGSRESSCTVSSQQPTARNIERARPGGTTPTKECMYYVIMILCMYVCMYVNTGCI